MLLFVEFLTQEFIKNEKGKLNSPFIIYFLPLPTRYRIRATTSTTTIIPDQTPALKMSPIAWQLLIVPAIEINNTLKMENL